MRIGARYIPRKRAGRPSVPDCQRRAASARQRRTDAASVLQSARVGLPGWDRLGTQHSRFNDKQSGSACQKSDDDPCYDSRTFARCFFGMMKLTQTAHPLPPRFARLGRLIRAKSPSVMATCDPGSWPGHVPSLYHRNAAFGAELRQNLRDGAAPQKAGKPPRRPRDAPAFEPGAAS